MILMNGPVLILLYLLALVPDAVSGQSLDEISDAADLEEYLDVEDVQHKLGTLSGDATKTVQDTLGTVNGTVTKLSDDLYEDANETVEDLKEWFKENLPLLLLLLVGVVACCISCCACLCCCCPSSTCCCKPSSLCCCCPGTSSLRGGVNKSTKEPQKGKRKKASDEDTEAYFLERKAPANIRKDCFSSVKYNGKSLTQASWKITTA